METQANKIDLTAKAQALVRLHESANTFMNQNSLFNPGTPPTPMFGDEAPHIYQYTPGINLLYIPRAGYGGLPFPALRALGAASKEIRLNIELIKRQVRGLEWEIVPNPRFKIEAPVMVGGVMYHKTADTQAVQDFFEFPDGVNDHDAWMNMLIEEILVTDAVTLFPSEQDGRMILEIIDGTTIRPLVDFRGGTPKPPNPAYLQILHGVPTTHHPANSLIYRPLNTKTYTPYGESPIEWVLTAINTAIRLDAQRIGYYTEGNVPAAFGFLPENWTPEQIQVWADYFDALMKGDINRVNKIFWLPGGGGASNPVYPFAQHDQTHTDIDKYLMEVACWAFGNAPAEFGIVPGAGLGGKSFMTASGELQMKSMMGPITGYLHSLFNLIITKYLRRPDLKFQYVGLDPTPDKLNQAQVDQIYYEMGAYDMGYIQDRLGVPANFRPAAAPMAAPTSGVKEGGAGTVQKSRYFTRAVKADLGVWREKVTRAMKKNWPMPGFESEVIPSALMLEVKHALNKVKSPDEIAAIFEKASSNLEKMQTAVTEEGGGGQPFFRKSNGRRAYP